jgi:hypothetical protein
LLFSAVTFSFISGNTDEDGGPYFVIDPYTAQLYTAFPFDYETRKIYNLTLQIRDESPAPGGPPLLINIFNLTLVSPHDFCGVY